MVEFKFTKQGLLAAAQSSRNWRACTTYCCISTWVAKLEGENTFN